jgi:putative heme-binding domain-containing protein
MRHPDRDNKHGRVWRITAKGRPLVKPPVLAGKQPAELLDHLKSKEHWVRYQVKRLLAASSLDQVKPALSEWIQELNPADSEYEHNLMEALGVCESHEWVNQTLLAQLANGKNANARSYAARVTGRWHNRLDNPFLLLEALINDNHPRVRLEALVALSGTDHPKSMAIGIQVLDHPMDKFIEYALEKTIHALRPCWEPALQSESLSFKRNAHLARVISSSLPGWYTPGKLRSLIETGRFPIGVEENLLLELAKSGNEGDIEFILGHPVALANGALLDRLSKTDAKPLSEKGVGLLRKLLSSSVSSSVRQPAIRLINAWKVYQMEEAVFKLVKNKAEPVSVRSESLEALVRLKGRQSLPLLNQLVSDSQTSRAIRLASLKALSELDLTLASAATVQEMLRSGNSSKQMQEAFMPIVDRSGGIKALTDELEKTDLPVKHARLALEAMAARGLDVPALRKRLEQLAREADVAEREYTPDYLNQLAKAVTEQGNPMRGQLIYQSMPTCGACHAINGKGGNIGPNLSAIGRGLSPREIAIEVLWPNQNIKEGYEMVSVETKKGEVIQGNKVFETSEDIYLKTPGANDARKISKGDIVNQKGGSSLMPPGLVNTLSEEEVRDLIRYLSELGNKEEPNK